MIPAPWPVSPRRLREGCLDPGRPGQRRQIGIQHHVEIQPEGADLLPAPLLVGQHAVQDRATDPRMPQQRQLQVRRQRQPRDDLRQGAVEERLQHGPFPFPFSTFQQPGAPGKKQGGSPPSFTPKEILDYLESLPDADQVADLVSCALLPGAIERQTILETVQVEQRLRHLIHFLMEEIRRCRKDLQG